MNWFILFATSLLGSTHDATSIAGIVHNEWIQRGGRRQFAPLELLGRFCWAFMNFATLTEVPLIQGLLASGMGDGPALALLLAGPSLSLPSMLVINQVMGLRKTAVYVALVIVMATLSGWIFGALS